MDRVALAVAFLASMIPHAPSQVPLGKNFCFVVDTSGSMESGRMNRAVGATLFLAQQSVDDFNACLYTFQNIPLRWKQGWVKLPDAEHTKALHDEIKLRSVLGGGTLVIPALEKAFAEKKKKELTVFLISDGEFYAEFSSLILHRIEVAQAKREPLYGRAVIMTVCVNKKQRTIMTEIGKTGKGGAYQWEDK